MTLPPELAALVDAYYRAHQTQQRTVAAAIARLWRAAGPSGFREVLDTAAGMLAAGQLVAAVRAVDYVAATAAAQDAAPATARVVPRAFAGETAAGRSLVDVLGAPVARSWALIGSGADLATASAAGELMLTRIVGNEIAQSGTDAAAAAIATQPDINGFVRVLRTPSCGRCAVLAGKWFEWNAGFARHPGCDCVHVPAAERATVDAARINPRVYFDSLTEPQRRRLFGAAVTDKVTDGADLTRTVNATWGRPPRSRRVTRSQRRGDALRDLAARGLIAA